MRSPEKVRRHVVRCNWKCKHCREVIGTENRSHYGIEPPEMIAPTWFFASMTLLDHLRDCGGMDFSVELKGKFGEDFLNHDRIFEWFNEHATVERQYMAQQDLDME